MNTKTFIGAIILIGLLAISGCTSKPAYSGDNSSPPSTSPAAVAGKEVATIEISLAQMKNWDADPEADGIEFNLLPKDKDDDRVQVEGVLNARAYMREWDFQKTEFVKGELVKEWSSVPVGADYGFLGSTVRLEFDDSYIPSKDSMILEVDFVYNGKTYSAVKDNVFNLSG